MSYQPTIYEKIVQDYLSHNLEDFKHYSPEWTTRGYNQNDFDQYLEDIKYAVELTEQPDFNMVRAAHIAKQYVKNRKDIVIFSLTDDEKKTVLETEDLG